MHLRIFSNCITLFGYTWPAPHTVFFKNLGVENYSYNCNPLIHIILLPILLLKLMWHMGIQISYYLRRFFYIDLHLLQDPPTNPFKRDSKPSTCHVYESIQSNNLGWDHHFVSYAPYETYNLSFSKLVHLENVGVHNYFKTHFFYEMIFWQRTLERIFIVWGF